MTPPDRQIRAVFDVESITVYQAYSPAIADPALAAGRFVPPFRRERMTWVKPSFLWMMYRAGWGDKPGQERVLAVRMSRAGFEEALSSACLSHFDPALYPDRESWERRKAASPVRVQWDPERSPTLDPLPWRSLQVGLGGTAALRYPDEWVLGLTEVTGLARRVRDGELDALPPERPYPLPTEVARVIGASEQE